MSSFWEIASRVLDLAPWMLAFWAADRGVRRGGLRRLRMPIGSRPRTDP